MSIRFDVEGFAAIEIADNDARSSLKTYFARYTGRHFEHFADQADPMRFSAADVAAVATLSVPLEGEAVVGLLIDHAERLTELLGDPRMPHRSETLWGVDQSVLASDRPLAMVYEELKRIPGISYVRASKLLAAKRPHLVPIRDSVVEQLLNAETAYWGPMRQVLDDAGVRASIQKASDDVVPANVSLLRRLDVILWTEGKKRNLGTRRS